MHFLCLDVKTQYNFSFKNNPLVCPIIKKKEQKNIKKFLHLNFFYVGKK